MLRLGHKGYFVVYQRKLYQPIKFNKTKGLNMIKYDPIYKKISKEWYLKSREIKNSKYAKFFFLWCSFNAIYNLIGKCNTTDKKRIKKLINELKEEDAEIFFKEVKQFCNYFVLRRSPIKDMKKEFHGKEQPKEVTDFESIIERYNANKEKIEIIKDIMIIIYRVRNNLTHGSKEFSGNDYEVIENSIPILEVIVNLVYKRVFGERFE
ncbi:hypothetical protein ES704_00264 [subsurface metagenome]|jgi:hypothetical protein